MRDRQKKPPQPPVPADIESRVAERTRELEAARAELEAKSRQIEEVDRLKNAFIANMSHEIRTPLNSVLALTQLLREGVAGPLTVDQRKYLQVIERNGRGLLHLINDVLDLSRIEAGHLEMDTEDLDLGRHVESVVEALAPLAAGKNIDLAVNIPRSLPAARGDPDRFRQILTNLIGNAIKFTEHGGQVMVGAEAQLDTIVVVGDRHRRRDPRSRPRRSSRSSIRSIRRWCGGRGDGARSGDRAPARPADGRRHQRRERGQPRLPVLDQVAARLGRAQGGIRGPRPGGLARWSSRRIPDPAERRVASSPTSPAASPASPSGLPGAAPDAMALPATVLVVEDNEDNLFTLRQILARRRLEIVTATNGRQAIERCRRQPRPIW